MEDAPTSAPRKLVSSTTSHAISAASPAAARGVTATPLHDGSGLPPLVRASPAHKSSPMAPSSATYSPFLMESYNMSTNLGLSASLHGFSSPASFFSGCPEDAASEEDIYSTFSHLPTASNNLNRQGSHGQQAQQGQQSQQQTTQAGDDTSDDEDDEDDDDAQNAGLWNCLVCTRLNQNDHCVFCGQEKEQPFRAQTRPTGQLRRPIHTAIGYDDRMRLHREVQPRDMYDLHPERPDRIAAIYEQCQVDGVIERCTHIPSVFVDKNDLLRCHDADYLEQLDDLFQLPYHHITPDTYCCRDTDTAAKLSAGIVVSLVDKVVHNEIRNGFAIVRPPGHHAEPQHAMGFCMFNNVAVAAKTAVEKFGVARVLILDWDIHHGNGTEHMFEDDPSVLYCSLHRFDNHGAFYPGTGAPDSVGKGRGAGFNVNIGWPSGGIGDAEYLAAFDRVLMPIFRAYDPEIVLVSAGFDSALGDPLGRCRLTPAGYARMTHQLSSLAHGKIVLALEGGYNLRSIATSASACIRILLGDPVPPFEDVPSAPMENALRAIETTRGFLLPYWPCLLAVEDDGDDDDDDDEASGDDQGDDDQVDAFTGDDVVVAKETDTRDDKKNDDANESRDRQKDALAAKIEMAAALDPRITEDIRAKLREKRRYRPYVAAHKR
ncbi:Aste57867_12552 [Aphanomyces stellatus]|uniref:Aste57867_12552 protein n=1 Tax=Aphanomyces stellatus TaxID=120398 RepID=A0A485KWM9_9STRA|nr:hypothetical protein As57867_012506 [Aphanomyces stellatus]VFT89403.1 Aste57867_12552 [Aphanomyces stellatus]